MPAAWYSLRANLASPVIALWRRQLTVPDFGQRPAAERQAAYTTDVDYKSRFGVLQTPIHMVVVAGLAGWQGPDPSAPFTYYDIACGDGETLVLLAAAYPHGRFVGVDFNPAHVRAARAKAQEAELDNVEVHQADILDLPQVLSRPFDFVAVAGAYSWLDEERRVALREFFALRGKDNALIFVDYAAQPGSAAADALYQILRKRAEVYQGNSAERLQQAARSLHEQAKSDALFFRHYPTARSRLDDLLRHDPADEAHEVFNHDRGLWFEEVAGDMAESGLVWTGNATLKRAIPESILPQALVATASEMDQETMDVALDTAYRADVFTTHGRSKVGAAQALADRALIDPTGTTLQRLTAIGKRFPQWQGKAMDRVVAGVRADITSVADLDSDDLTITRLLAVSAIQVAVRQPSPATPRPSNFRIAGTYNALVLTRDIGAIEPRPFACPVAGTSISLPLIDRVALFVMTGGDPDAVYNKLVAAGVSTDEAFGTGRAEFARTAASLAKAFARDSAPILLKLGVIEPQ